MPTTGTLTLVVSWRTVVIKLIIACKLLVSTLVLMDTGRLETLGVCLGVKLDTFALPTVLTLATSRMILPIPPSLRLKYFS
jgi:hypothetical protein